MNAYWKKYQLNFKVPGGTSRGVLQSKESWFFIVENAEWQLPAIGECSVIRGLNPEPMLEYEGILDQCIQWINGEATKPILDEFPSIAFGLEMLESDMKSKGSKIHFQSEFTAGKSAINTNGLIWMGDIISMKEQIKGKIKLGFDCIKLKIGAIDFESELALLQWIRTEFQSENPEIRLDANGAFNPTSALEKLKKISAFEIHSIEQPIAVNQWDDMAQLCQESPVRIALDEELIGLKNEAEMRAMLQHIIPKYIILKPSLIGGWAVSNVYIDVAENLGIEWWMTSALESNIGLNAIAQYTFTKNHTLPQGLGTGALYSNNFASPLHLAGQKLTLKPETAWNLSLLNQ